MMFQTLSSWATSSVEEVASTGPGIRFFQLYVSCLMNNSDIPVVTRDGSHVMIVLSRYTRTGRWLSSSWEEPRKLGSKPLLSL